MRLTAYIILIFLSTLLPWYLLSVLVLMYALRYTAYELIVLAIAIDAYYGVYYTLSYYTFAAVALLICVEWAKPRFLIYNE
jgi:hypothetical protein